MSGTDRSHHDSREGDRAAEHQLAAARLRLDAVCQTVASGRTAARQLAKHASGIGLNEAEFRLLWQLSKSIDRSAHPDQKRLAEQLGLSAPQVSAVVERLRTQGYVEGETLPTDRRRQVWRLTGTGLVLLDRYVQQMVVSEPGDNTSSADVAFWGDGEEAA